MIRDHSTGVSLYQIAEKTRGNRGYLRIGLRLMVGNGWLQYRNNSYTLMPAGFNELEVAQQLYRETVSFIPMAIFLEDFLFGESQGSLLPSLQVLVDKAKAGWGLTNEHEQLRLQLDGMLVGPAMVALSRHGVFDMMHGIEGNQSCLSVLFDLLTHCGWVVREQSSFGLTPAGRYAASIASAYGVTVSYLPMLSVVSTLMFGNPRIPRVDETGVEMHVNRATNVWGGGRAHLTYFKKVNEIVIQVFNRPIELQPGGVCDLGCGDGTFLRHVYQVVRDNTARGKVLDKYPLLIVGADSSKVSRRISKQNFKKAQIPNHHVIHGDINRPAQLASDLEALGVDIHDLLHVRSFLDHNRPWLPPSGYMRGTRQSRSTGAFAHLGDEILPDELEENLVRHLRRWAPYVGRFGLLVLELHTLPPLVTAANLE